MRWSKSGGRFPFRSVRMHNATGFRDRVSPDQIMSAHRRNWVVLMVCVALLGCATDQHRYDAAMDPVNLGIPDRQWDPKRPDPSVGWCAETCIQMAIGYYGQEVSQKQINQAGAPRHPDLYVYDIDNALNALGVSFICFDEPNSDLSAFIVWIQDNLRCGHLVICGCKLYPDEHPDWNLDHFVLVVGCNAEGLLLNTQLDKIGRAEERRVGKGGRYQW